MGEDMKPKKPKVRIAMAIPPTQCICGGELEILRPSEEYMKEHKIDHFAGMSFEITGAGEQVIPKREYDLVECKNCGRAHWQRIKKPEATPTPTPTLAIESVATSPTGTSGMEVA